jgi:hypothetical protein
LEGLAMRRIIFVLMSLLLLMMAVAPVSAQANLLTNPGFEQPYGGGYQRNTAQGWSSWVGNGNADFYPEQYGSVRGGVNSQAIKSEFVFDGASTFDVAVYQVVSGIPVGSVVQASGWGSMFLAQVPDPANANARLLVGIDPNGGTNPNDGDVAWVRIFNASAGYDAGGGGWLVDYIQGSAQVTTTGGNVTVFLRWKQLWGGLEHRVFFDDASLVVITAGDGTVPDPGDGSDPVATAVPAAPPPVSYFASPQGEREDGSIVHVVVANNTITTISVAYGVPVDEILALNPDIGDGRFIYVGQEILVRVATDGSETAPDAGDDAEATEDVSATTLPVATGVEKPTEDGAVATTEPIATVAPPTATPLPPTATTVPDAPVTVVADSAAGGNGAMTTSICVLLFEDLNQNRVQDQNEGLLAQGVINLKQGDTLLNTVSTDTSPEPRCFNDLAAGEYMLEAEAPAGYGLTSSARLGVRVQTGETLNMPFGASQGVAAVAPPPMNIDDQNPAPADTSADDDSALNDSELLQNIGLIVFGLAGFALLGGLGIALILRRSSAPQRRVR